MNSLIELIKELIAQHQQEVMMAWVQFIPAIAGAATSIFGAASARRAKKKEDAQMQAMQAKVAGYKDETAEKLQSWNADNELDYQNELNKDYTQTAEALNMQRQLREEMDRQTAASGNNNIISGATVEAQAANKDSQNKAMSNLMGNIGALATSYKDRATSRYQNNLSNLRGMELQTDNNLRNMEMSMEQQQMNRLGERRDSAGNMFYNGLKGMAGADWAGIMSSFKKEPVE